MLALLAASAGCNHSDDGGPKRTELAVFAAASLSDVMPDIGHAFEAVAPEVAIHFNFAGSNVLARQILAAPDAADVFLSADDRWMDAIEHTGRLAPDTRRVLLSNRLVVVTNARAEAGPTKPTDLASATYRYLSLADPDAVPAGRYARQFLERVEVGGSSLWDAVRARVAPAPDVRAALALVEADPEIIGIVYRTDAATSRRVRVAFEVPRELTPEIRYSVALTKSGARRTPAARAFLEFLSSSEAGAIFERYGFGLPAAERDR